MQQPTIEEHALVVDRRLVLRAVAGLALLLGVASLCGTLFREPIIAAGESAMELFGLAGLFLGVIVTDASPLPLTNEPLVILAISGGVPAWLVFFIVSVASVTAGLAGYCGGVLVGAGTPLSGWMRRKHPGFDAFLRRHGAVAVAICAFLPIPFALSTWSAGMVRVGFHKVAVASLVRVPKTAFYVWLIVQGWSLGAG